MVNIPEIETVWKLGLPDEELMCPRSSSMMGRGVGLFLGKKS